MSRAALAFKPRTGRAILVMLAGDFHEARVIERSEIPLLPAKKLGVTRARLDADLATLGKAAGPPWGKYQKEAAAAALVVLKHAKGYR